MYKSRFFWLVLLNVFTLCMGLLKQKLYYDKNKNKNRERDQMGNLNFYINGVAIQDFKL